MGSNGLPTTFVDAESELPSASKWNGNFEFLNFVQHNLLRNGDFEYFDSTLPVGWTLTGTGATSASDSDKKNGSLCALVTYGSADAYLTGAAIEVNFLKGRKVRAWCWVKTNAAAQARIKVVDGVGSTASSFHTGGNTYELLVVDHTVAAGATKLELELHVEGVGSARFDGAVLVDYEGCRGMMAPLYENADMLTKTMRLFTAAPTTPVKDTLYKDLMPKAWVKFAGATAAIDADVNVSGVVRDAAGTYTISFATAFANANYVAVGMLFDGDSADKGFVVMGTTAPGTGSCQIRTCLHDGTVQDFANVMVLFFGAQ